MASDAVSSDKPMTIGVFGGSFNPIHLGHALLAITTQQTKPVDQVVLVPVYKHAVKKDLLPFEDRVAMCELAVAPFRGDGGKVTVSTVEQKVGASNGAMLRALKEEYPPGTKFLWICGDDFFRWMERPKGLETLREVSGLIVQRRLHKAEHETTDRFFKEPIDEARVRAVAAKLDLEIDFIYGELPHFSSTLVRRAPGNWRSFLPQSVTKYLDEHPHLLEKLLANLEADAKSEQAAIAAATGKRKRSSSLETSTDELGPAAEWVMRGLEAVHSLQHERGRTGLQLSMGIRATELKEAQANTDALLEEILEEDVDEGRLDGFDEVLALAAELKQIPVWLKRDRKVLEKRRHALVDAGGVEGWAARLALVEKFNPRIDVLIDATLRALTEIRQNGNSGAMPSRDLPELLYKWCEGKEALGRLRAFVCAGGPNAPSIVRSSLKMRERLNQTIEKKNRSITRVLSLEAGMSSRLAAPDALHRLLEKVTVSEWSLMDCFASSTPLPLIHKLLSSKQLTEANGIQFDVEVFFEASTTAIDFLLSFAKALAAAGCARA